MKHRITYIRDNAVPFEPSQIKVEQSSLNVLNLRAAKEHRLTIGLSELPAELVRVLEQCHELRLRWASSVPYATASPFNARTPPGLHAFFTPIKGKEASSLCPTLKEVFGHDLKCGTVKQSFSTPPILSERFTSSTSAQYFHIVPSLAYLTQYIQSQICWPRVTACQEGALALLTATYLDMDYDAISHALIISAYWSEDDTEAGWTENIEQSKAGERIEVGILNAEDAKEREELSMSGFLAVIGDDDKAKPTMFSFPARHHPLPHSAVFQMAFDSPTGLHPTLRLSIDHTAVDAPPHPTCALHAYLTLPSHLFLDRHQFSDPLFLESHHLSALRALSGATDLEAPDWVVQQWGSAALFELAPSPASTASIASPFEATIPMHLRYLPPSPSGYTNASLPYPSVFWACRAEEGTKMTVNPFDRVGLGYDGLFGERTMFYHFVPTPAGGGVAQGEKMVSRGLWGDGGLLEARLTVPVLDTSRAAWVQSGTVGVVLLGFAWLVWKLLRPTPATGASATKTKKNK